MLIFIGCTNSSNWVGTLPKPWQLNEEQISDILPQFHKKFPDFHDRLRAFALWQVGKPYELFCLGEESGEDKDPIFRLDVSDCTVHILTSLASAQSYSWQEAKNTLIDIHYKPGDDGISIPTYKSRWHFTTDRIQDNPSTKNITSSLINNKELMTVNLTLNKKENGDEFLNLDWQKPTTVQFIPNKLIDKDLLYKLPSITGVAFVKKSYFKLGLVVAHEGMIIDKKNIIHASSEFGKTVMMDFMEYYFLDDGPRFDGILIFSFNQIEV
ncbi:uncharacterized protein METZ01_LOCUS144355 [marine metagenome]|uniref:DUF1460 domain-containing protein n=1 Tax=marine metagenome TaxID=408172 RepID=A0A381ZRA8_9ZZZZ